MLNIIKDQLLRIVDDIDNDNSQIPDEQQQKEMVNFLKEYTQKNDKLSKYQACTFLNISRAKFDNLVKDGVIPKGRKQQGFKELFWYRRDLERSNEFKNR